MKYIEATSVLWPEVRKFYGSLTLLHFPTGEAMHKMSASTQFAEKITTSRIYFFLNNNVILQGI